MKGGVRKKSYSIFIISNFFTFPLAGWYLGGIIPAIVGFVLALIIDTFFITWNWELTWKDIDLALYNLYKHGRHPSRLWFRVGNRKIQIYRDEKGSKKRPIRMAVCIPSADWSDILSQEDYRKLLSKVGGKIMPSSCDGEESYDIYPREGVEGCKEILKILFQKAEGGLTPYIMAESSSSTKKPLWVNHEENEKKKLTGGGS